MSSAPWRWTRSLLSLSRGGLLFLAPLFVAPQARSQVAVSATATTNYLYRGLSLSDGRPAIDLSLVYDVRSGFYVGGSLIGEETRHRGFQGLGHQEYAGYALRLSPGSTLDLGVNNLHYKTYGDYPYSADATAVYVGWVRGPLNYYVHYSPDYFYPGARTLYAEINGAVRLRRPLRLFGHVGVLTPLGGGYDDKERYDVRLGVAAAFKHGEAQLAWTTARPAPAYADGASQGRGVLALAVTWNF